MKIAQRLAQTLVVIMLITLIATVPIARWYQGRARLYQRVLVSEQSALFGEIGEKIGSPQQLIIEDTRAIVGQPGNDGATLVDENYLKNHHIYPLQLQTVTFILQMIRIGTGAVLTVALITIALTGQQLRKVSPSLER